MIFGQTNSNNNLRTLPKVELHRHLEGAIRFSTLLELAPKVGINVPTVRKEQEDFFLVQTPMVDLKTVLRKFMSTQAVIESEEILTRITFEAIEDAANENIRLLELRFAPTFILENHPNLNLDKILKGVARGLELAKNLPVGVGFLGIIQRTKDLTTSKKIMDHFVENKGFYVGVDLADDEEFSEPERFKDIFAQAKKAQFPVTIHAGETPSPKAGERIEKAVKELGASRIGHGLQCIHHPATMNFLKKEQILLELCPTSNWLTQSVKKIEDHPFRKIMEFGIPASLNSDDPGVFGIDLTHEYNLLNDKFHFTIQEFQKLNQMAAEYSFIPNDIKRKFWSF